MANKRSVKRPKAKVSRTLKTKLDWILKFPYLFPEACIYRKATDKKPMRLKVSGKSKK